jgi:hypothetical protein
MVADQVNGYPDQGWTVETLRQLVLSQDAANHRLLAEMDLRYQQRYDAQIKALDAALLAAEKAVQTALTAAEKAVAKAETAAEKRFESVNEFRAQLSDQAGTFIPRAEYDARQATTADKVTELAERVNVVNGRIDVGEGRIGGHTDSTRNLVTVVGLALTAITVLVGLYLAFKG